MARLPIPYGDFVNDPDPANSVPIRTAWQRADDNFTDLYSSRSEIISAGDVRFADELTTEAKITAAHAQAQTELSTLVFIPASMSPYNPALVTYISGIRTVREGGDFSVYDVQAYGADETGVLDAGPAWNACRAAVPAAGGPMRVPFGTYNLATAFTFGTQENVRVLIDAGVVLTGNALPLTDSADNNTIIDFREGLSIVGGGISVTLTPLQLAIYQAPSGAISGNAGSRPEYGMFAARGTITTPTATLEDDCLGVLGYYGHTGSAYTASPAASIYVNALEDFTGTANGTEIAFLVTPVGAAADATQAYYAMASTAFRPATNLANLVDIGSVSIPFRYGRFKTGLVVGDDNATIRLLINNNLTTGVVSYTASGGSDPYHSFNTRIRHPGTIDTTGADFVLQRASVTMLTLGSATATFSKGDLTLTPVSSTIGVHSDTADAADTAVFKLSPGGSFSSSRGALIQLFGNEHASTGQIIMTSGNVAGAQVIIQNKGAAKLTIDDSVITPATLLTTVASATGLAGFRLPHGTAPSSPVNGDIWTTTAGLFVRINGSTVGPLS